MVRWTSEFIGTFFLVFFGTGAIVVGDAFPGTIPHIAIAATFGLVVMTMIYAIGDTSGAHINPARSLGPAMLSGQLGDLWIYLVGPIAGAVLAILSCRIRRDRCCTILPADRRDRD